MIWVDDLRPRGALWRGGVACRMVSDDSVEELVSFACALGCQRHWLQGSRGEEHYEISPRLRARAVLWGAHPCSGRDVVAHQDRRRLAEEARRDAAVAALMERGEPHPGRRG